MTPIHYVPMASYNIEVYEEDGKIIILSKGKDVTGEYEVSKQGGMVVVKIKRLRK